MEPRDPGPEGPQRLQVVAKQTLIKASSRAASMMPLLAAIGSYQSTNWNARGAVFHWITHTVMVYAATQLVIVPLSWLSPLISSRPPNSPDILRSPLQRTLSQPVPEDHPYPPDAIPGARSVQTPHGTLRAYEFGPETGRKVLLIHGISTPCIALATLARLLTEEHGCRVCLFDLAGRGYSDCADPQQERQDLANFVGQIFAVLGSSPTPGWLGGDSEDGKGLSVVGYSMGGGIAAGFCELFPRLVGSLVLIAPSGVVRPERLGKGTKLLYSGLLPKSLVSWLVARRLSGGGPAAPGQNGNAAAGDPEATAGPGQVAVSEVPKNAGHPALMRDSDASLFADRPGISVANAVAWELEQHPGFVPAFVSSIQHAPITGQHERWRTIGSRQQVGRKVSTNVEAKGIALRECKALVLLGMDDGVIVRDETEADAMEAFGKENVQIEVLEGGHDVPIVNAKGCANAIAAFWR